MLILMHSEPQMYHFFYNIELIILIENTVSPYKPCLSCDLRLL